MSDAANAQSTQASRRALIGAAAIATLVFACYFPALSGAFILDDANYVENPLIAAPDGLLGIWLTRGFEDYYAFTHTTFWIEWRLWGENTTGYHAVNLVLHILNALLVWKLLGRLRVPGAFAAAVLFALHPVNVQAVAWISQRKTLLAGAFVLASLLAWLKFDDGGRRRLEWYGVVLGAFTLALLSKISAAVLPVLILLVVWWRRGRVEARDLWPVAPLLALALLFGINGIAYEQLNPVSAPDAPTDASFAGRTAAVGYAIWFYLEKAFWPSGLTFLYPHWELDASSPLAFAPIAAFAVLLAAAWWRRDAGGRAAFAALVWFAVGLAPILGYLDFGHLRFSPVADHHQYLSLVAVCGLAGCIGARAPKVLGVSALGAVAIAWFALTYHQAGLYHSPETIYLDTLAKNPGSWRARNNLGSFYLRRGDFESARESYAAALRIGGDVDTHANLGLARLAQDDLEGALQNYRDALAIDPDHARSHLGLGNVRLAQERPSEAIQHYRDALQRDPNFAEANARLADLLVRSGDLEAAIRHFSRALEQKPEMERERRALANAHSALGATLAARGELDAAIVHFRRAVALAPGEAQKLSNLGLALATAGELREAAHAYERALELDPTYQPARVQLGRLRGARMRASPMRNPDAATRDLRRDEGRGNGGPQ